MWQIIVSLLILVFIAWILVDKDDPKLGIKIIDDLLGLGKNQDK